ncbi:MAG: hypothetical protein BWX79_01349 [Alphaproteobacteria bacterium ADurb.Bin100]|nr:MAG: hypothetical protein BWX79_01349 [Alphaproteobacteria bacterium ADurb.Bin100]
MPDQRADQQRNARQKKVVGQPEHRVAPQRAERDREDHRHGGISPQQPAQPGPRRRRHHGAHKPGSRRQAQHRQHRGRGIVPARAVRPEKQAGDAGERALRQRQCQHMEGVDRVHRLPQGVSIGRSQDHHQRHQPEIHAQHQHQALMPGIERRSLLDAPGEGHRVRVLDPQQQRASGSVCRFKRHGWKQVRHGPVRHGQVIACGEHPPGRAAAARLVQAQRVQARVRNQQHGGRPLLCGHVQQKPHCRRTAGGIKDLRGIVLARSCAQTIQGFIRPHLSRRVDQDLSGERVAGIPEATLRAGRRRQTRQHQQHQTQAQDVHTR